MGMERNGKPVVSDEDLVQGPHGRWLRYYMGFALHARTQSKDSTQVGAVLVGPDGEIRMTAYNGPPRGVKDLRARFERPTKYLYASHAEMNLIAFCARQGVRTEGCTVYVTHHPCSVCARLLIQAGIKAVIYGDGQIVGMPAEEFEASRQMCAEAGVTLRDVDDQRVALETPDRLAAMSHMAASRRSQDWDARTNLSGRDRNE